MGDKRAWKWIFSKMDSFEVDQRGPHRVFKRFHRALTARYPCICSLSDEEVDNGVWADGPLINNFGWDFGVVALSFPAVSMALPFVVRTAARYGIFTFDEQINLISRPRLMQRIRAFLRGFRRRGRPR